MTDRDRLQELLRSTPFLIADGAVGIVQLVPRKDALEAMAQADPFHSQVVMNIGRSLPGFAKIVGKADREFTLTEIAKIAGVEYAVGHLWMREGVLHPSIRPAAGAGKGRGPRFSWKDAFVAGICGSLRRQGLGLDTLKEVSPLILKNSKIRVAAAR